MLKKIVDPNRFMKLAATILVLLLIRTAMAGEKAYTFGMLNQRNAVLTAQYWNPILEYVGRKSGVLLQLKIGKTVRELDDMTEGGEFDFIYSNHIFMPRIAKAGYQVIARPVGESFRGQIVVLENAPIHALKDLNGKEVAFSSEAAFAAYAVTMDAMLRQGIHVKPVFAGNQEGVIGQLKAGRVPAASVNSQILLEFARRERIKFRELWSSDLFAAIPIAVHRRVDKKQVKAVQETLVGMASDPEGLKVLKACAALIKQNPPLGFETAVESDYENQRMFYRTTVFKGF
jgi:phosphonate transport system substrate-binding protein